MKINTRLAAVSLGVLVGALAMSGPAQATEIGYSPTGSANCPNASGWYVNVDENGDGQPTADTVDLRPEQKPAGFLFNGPSIIHHHTASPTGIKLADVEAGSFTAALKVGALPLFKMETANPYSTVNVTAGGKFWSSKIGAADVGGQSNPVDTAGDLVGLWNYTAATVVGTFGVGYAKDTGNSALVKSVTFDGKIYPLACYPPSPSPSASPTPSSSPSPSASATATQPGPTAPAPLPTGGAGISGPSLPVTGAGTGVLIAVGVMVAATGAFLIVLSRRRKVDFAA